jgi:hypothetical protein
MGFGTIPVAEGIQGDSHQLYLRAGQRRKACSDCQDLVGGGRARTLLAGVRRRRLCGGVVGRSGTLAAEEISCLDPVSWVCLGPDSIMASNRSLLSIHQ